MYRFALIATVAVVLVQGVPGRASAGKAKAMLEWIVQGPDTLMPHAVLYPDSERVRAAAKMRQVDLLPRK